MKYTGIIRPVDGVGRVVIPKEIRQQLNVENSIDSFEIYTENDAIILKKYQPTCIFCDTISECIEYEGKIVCKDCIEKMTELSRKSQCGDTADEENTL